MVVRNSHNSYVLHCPWGLGQSIVCCDYGEQRNGVCEKKNVVGDPMTSGDGRRYLYGDEEVSSPNK